MNNLEALIECYLDICQYEKKLSQDTLKAYRTDLAQFRAFVGGLPAGLLSFDGDTGSDFTESL